MRYGSLKELGVESFTVLFGDINYEIKYFYVTLLRPENYCCFVDIKGFALFLTEFNTWTRNSNDRTTFNNIEKIKRNLKLLANKESETW